MRSLCHVIWVHAICVILCDFLLLVKRKGFYLVFKVVNSLSRLKLKLIKICYIFPEKNYQLMKIICFSNSINQIKFYKIALAINVN